MTDGSLLLGYVLQLAMVLVRVLGLWAFFPIFSRSTIPVLVKMSGGVAIAMALTPSVSPLLPQWTISRLPETYDIFKFVLSELVIGAGMGLVVKWIFTSCLAGAQWVGTQIGFSMGAMFDPEMGGNETSWAEFNNWIFVMIFFSVGGHHLMLQGLVDSYNFKFDDMFSHLSQVREASQLWGWAGDQFFAWMLKLSAPLVVIVLGIQAAMGVLSKFVPQINVWMVSIPITIGLSVLVFSFLSPVYGDALKDLAIFNFQGQQVWLKYLGAR